MNNSELRDTTMISMVRFAIIVLMAFRDLRFLSTVFIAHFTRLISFLLFPMLSIFYSGSVFEKTGKFKQGIKTRQHRCAHLIRVQVNWLFRVVTTVIVYELPLTIVNPVPEPE